MVSNESPCALAFRAITRSSQIGTSDRPNTRVDQSGTMERIARFRPIATTTLRADTRCFRPHPPQRLSKNSLCALGKFHVEA